MIHVAWGAPLTIATTLYLIYVEIRWASFVGLAAMFLLVPATAFIGSQLNKLRRKLVGFTDKRTSFMDEVITGIRVIKYYAWEQPFKYASLLTGAAETRQHTAPNSLSVTLQTNTCIYLPADRVTDCRERVRDVREEEAKILRRVAVYQACFALTLFVGPVLVGIASFAAYTGMFLPCMQ